jgi:hypothetical protein
MSVARRLMVALARLPADEYLTLRVEEGEDGARRLTAVLFEEAPEGGWETEGDYFGDPPDSPRHRVPCRESWRHDGRVLLGVTGDPARPGEFARDLADALEAWADRKGGVATP